MQTRAAPIVQNELHYNGKLPFRQGVRSYAVSVHVLRRENTVAHGEFAAFVNSCVWVGGVDCIALAMGGH